MRGERRTIDDTMTLLAAYDEVLGGIRDALQKDVLRERLMGPPIEPIFKVR